MPRKPRMYLPDIPAHIVHRGNNRGSCFFSPDDYFFYLDRLNKALKRYKVYLHAYVLMTNHVHLLMTPKSAEGISKVMSLLGKQYVMYINKKYKRSGTLWEGRHKASIVDSDEYLLMCYFYIELNPVRAGIVNKPGEYRWSSYQYNGLNRPDPLISEHDLYTGLGDSRDKRCNQYRNLLKTRFNTNVLGTIRNSNQFNFPLGNSQFKEKIESILGRNIGYAKHGRPYKIIKGPE